MKILITLASIALCMFAKGVDLVWDVPAGVTSNVTELIPDGSYTITKKGSGAVRYCPSDPAKRNIVPNFTGSWVIEAGTLQIPCLGNAGKPQALTVEDGGSFDYSGLTDAQSLADNFYAAKTVVTIAGSGVNGEGALVYSQGTGRDQFLRRLILSGDATISAPSKRYGMTTDYVDLRGYELTASAVIFRDKITITNENDAAILLPKDVVFQEIWAVGDESGRILFKGGGFNAHKIPADHPVPWTFFSDTHSLLFKCTLTTSANRLDDYNYFSGPVVAKNPCGIQILNSAGTMAPLNFTGDVFGEATLRKDKIGCARFFGNVAVTNNTTTMIDGYLRFAPAVGKKVQLRRFEFNGRGTAVFDLRNTSEGALMRYVDGNSGVFLTEPSGFSQVIVQGGEFRTDKFIIGCEGRSELTLMEGAKMHPNALPTMTSYLGYATSYQGNEIKCRTALNVIGEGSELDVGHASIGQYRPGDTISTVNVVDGGRICADYLRRMKVDSKDTTGLFYANFDGGTYVANTNGYVSGVLGLTNRANPDACTIYEGGLTVDTSRASELPGNGVTISFPLRHPVGKGLKSIPITGNNEFMSSQYSAHPFVEVIGVGTNAYAMLQVDEETRKPTSVRVVCRGGGYDETTRVAISDANNTAQYTFAPELYDYPDPTNLLWKGLTKVGDGTLTLQTTNHYYGPTVVMQGQLNLMGSARPIDSGLVVSNNATISFTSKDESAREIPFVAGAGTLTNYKNALSVRKLILSAKEAALGHVLKFDNKLVLPSFGATIELSDVETLPDSTPSHLTLCEVKYGMTGTATPVSLPDGWHLRQTANALTLIRKTGLVLIVR